MESLFLYKLILRFKSWASSFCYFSSKTICLLVTVLTHLGHQSLIYKNIFSVQRIINSYFNSFRLVLMEKMYLFQSFLNQCFLILWHPSKSSQRSGIEDTTLLWYHLSLCGRFQMISLKTEAILQEPSGYIPLPVFFNSHMKWLRKLGDVILKGVAC